MTPSLTNDIPSLTEEYSIPLPASGNANVSAFSWDSELLAVPLQKELLLLDTETGSTLGRIIGSKEHYVTSVAFSRDDKLIVISDMGMTRVFQFNRFDPSKSTRIKEIKTDEYWTKAVAFSPDGEYFVTGGSDATVKYWDVDGIRQLPGLGRCTHVIHDLAFSPDGNRLLAACQDSTLRIWKPMREDVLLDLHVPDIMPVHAEFADDGSAIVSGAGAYSVAFRAAGQNQLQRLEIERLPHFGCGK